MRRHPDLAFPWRVHTGRGPAAAAQWDGAVGAVDTWGRAGALDAPASEVAQWSERQRRRPWLLLASVLLSLAFLALCGWAVARHALRPTGSQQKALQASQAARPQPFQPTQAADPDVLAAIAWERVHVELLPGWVAALQRRPLASAQKEADLAFQRLRAEAGRDPNLLLLLDRLRDRVLDVQAFAPEIRELLRGWNEYLRRNAVGWHVEYRIDKTASGTVLTTRSYRVLADTSVQLDGEPQPVLLVARADRKARAEGAAGMTSADGAAALVVADRLAEFAAEQLWPALVPSGDAPATGMAARLRQEAALHLDEHQRLALVEAAGWRGELAALLSEVRTRTGCGGSVTLERVPWRGLSPSGLQMVRSVAEGNAARNCGKLTLADAAKAAELSSKLAQSPALEGALQALWAWAARSAAVHEAQHLADDRLLGGWERAPRCSGCPAAMTPKERAELSAYLSSMASDSTAYAALAHACSSEAAPQGAHAGALAFVLPRLLPGGCGGEIPDGLAQRAAGLRRELFGREVRLVIPGGFPRRLALRQD